MDLLNESEKQTNGRPETPPKPIHTRKSVHPPARARVQEENVPPLPVNHLPDRKLPFWRTTKGLIIIAIVAVVVIGAIVGGAVGGTVGHKNGSNKSAGLAPPTNSSSSSASMSINTPSTTSSPRPSQSSNSTSSNGGGSDQAGSGNSSPNPPPNGPHQLNAAITDAIQPAKPSPGVIEVGGDTGAVMGRAAGI